MLSNPVPTRTFTKVLQRLRMPVFSPVDWIS